MTTLRHCLALAVLAATALSLVATSRARVCNTSTLNVSAQTTCGPQANVSLVSDPSCAVAAGGAAFGSLPTVGTLDSFADDAGLDVGFTLSEFDGGSTRRCTATPTDAGFDLVCTECQVADGGCAELCTGTLTPQ